MVEALTTIITVGVLLPVMLFVIFTTIEYMGEQTKYLATNMERLPWIKLFKWLGEV